MDGRAFAQGNGVHRHLDYVVEVDVQDVVKALSHGKYAVLYGARQTGKTAMVFRVLEILQGSGFTCIYVDFPAYCSTIKCLPDFWRLITELVYNSSDGMLPRPDFSGIDSEEYFRRLFRKSEHEQEHVKLDIVLVFDEANHFCRIPNAFKLSFLNNLRELKQQSNTRVRSIMLVGTASLLDDLRISNKYRKLLQIGSREYSPFSSDCLYTSTNFTQEEVWQLISQFSDDKKVVVDREVSDSIWTCAGGHKGLVGICCGLLADDRTMRNFGHRDAVMWSNFAKMHLIDNVFRRPTYNAMWENCSSLEGDEQQFLLRVLQNGGSLELKLSENRPALKTIEFLVDEGILVDTAGRDDWSELHISSDLLHSFLLKQVGTEGDISVERGPLPFNNVWVIMRTIEVLDLDVLLQKEARNADGLTSEYSLQFEFFIRLKNVLKLGYPHLEWKVVPEAKCEANWRRRLDILVRDGETASWFAFELLRQGTQEMLSEHYERALWYAQRHSCIVYMINFVLQGEESVFKGEEGAPVVVFNVYIHGDHARMLGNSYGDGGFKDVTFNLRNIKPKLAWDFME